MQSPMLRIDIDPSSGFCTGVKRAVNLAEKYLSEKGELFCLGEFIHNDAEMKRLEALGMKVIDHSQIGPGAGNVFVRAHGEPPETFKKIEEADIRLIDATCPVVSRLQNRVKRSSQQLNELGKGKVIIFGKPGHSEVIGLLGQTSENALVISRVEEGQTLNVKEPLHIFAQTTANQEAFRDFCDLVKSEALLQTGSDDHIVITNSICSQVSRRAPALREFAREHDIVIFVRGINSSNGRYLAGVACEVNPRTHVVSHANEVGDWFKADDHIGISGATSTPLWQMQHVADHIQQRFISK
jgi:4-hydroxy-3-methylbut-2-enyl diphosphate reductase